MRVIITTGYEATPYGDLISFMEENEGTLGYWVEISATGQEVFVPAAHLKRDDDEYGPWER